MGLAASQAQLLQLTARISDVEFEAQQIQNAKLRLALQEDEVSQKYLEALDAETLTIPWGSDGQRIAATFDNICGIGSLNNAYTNKHHIFYDEDGLLIVPSDVYSRYQEFGGTDPYEFAMHMMGVDLDAKDNDENSIYENITASVGAATGNDILSTVFKKYSSQLEEIWKSSPTYQKNYKNMDENSEEYKSAKDDFINQTLKALITDGGDLKTHFFSYQDGTLNEYAPKNLEELEGYLKDIQDDYRNDYEYTLYKKNSGAEKIYNAMADEGCTSGGEFDKSLFNYYVRWAQLIEREEGLDGCIPGNAYNGDVENNSKLFNDMILSGKISIDIVYDNGKSGLDVKPTSTSTDSILNFQNTSTIDSTAVKKAEAEYNREMKKLNQVDKRYDLSLNRLETERNALTKQYDSVKKVAEDNIERTFGIFS